MIFYKMQNLQRKEALNQKVEENKPVLELKKYRKKSVSEYLKGTFLILPPMSMRPNGHGCKTWQAPGLTPDLQLVHLSHQADHRPRP